jgi:hypothetical protein
MERFAIQYFLRGDELLNELNSIVLGSTPKSNNIN